VNETRHFGTGKMAQDTLRKLLSSILEWITLQKNMYRLKKGLK